MATFTENYSLIKPDGEDYYDVADFNENMDTLDAAMAAAETAVNEVSAKIGTPPAAGQTVFSLLTRGDITFAYLFKSVQRVRISSPDTSVSIRTVDPAKCLVFVERVYNQNDSLSSYDYVLHADHIEMTSFSGANKDVTLDFSIIEFH